MEDFRVSSEYICPICGGDVEHMIHPTYPPQNHYKCLKCGQHKDVWQQLPEQKFAPFDK